MSCTFRSPPPRRCFFFDVHYTFISTNTNTTHHTIITAASKTRKMFSSSSFSKVILAATAFAALVATSFAYCTDPTMAEVMVLTSEDDYASTSGYLTATLGSTTTNLESGCGDEYDYGQVEFYDLDDLDDYDEITIGFSSSTNWWKGYIFLEDRCVYDSDASDECFVFGLSAETETVSPCYGSCTVSRKASGSTKWVASASDCTAC